MDHLNYQRARDELRRKRDYIQDLRTILVADDEHKDLVLQQQAITAIENAVWDLDDAISAIYELGQKSAKKE